jgi:hypothetical protein
MRRESVRRGGEYFSNALPAGTFLCTMHALPRRARFSRSRRPGDIQPHPSALATLSERQQGLPAPASEPAAYCGIDTSARQPGTEVRRMHAITRSPRLSRSIHRAGRRRRGLPPVGRRSRLAAVPGRCAGLPEVRARDGRPVGRRQDAVNGPRGSILDGGAGTACPVEAAVCYLISEALANAVKH